MQIQDFFRMGMKREIKELIRPEPPMLNLGCGDTLIDGARNLDLPEWNADEQPIPAEDNSINHVFAFHFLEHVKEPVKLLLEIQRVLKPGGAASIVVPYARADIAFQDLDHKHFFTEETWKTLLKNQYYGKFRLNWQFDIHANFILGIVGRNLAIFTQLVKQA